ncbi:MAG TPA: HEAT repeat domain-containing protein [Kofleriaceae bacterium]|nr:HEAT repeat domain-containing protein [Kofleriaceae bacterium]
MAVIALSAVTIAQVSPARADNVDDLKKQANDSSDKVRLSAAINLTKTGDPRAILILAGLLGKDASDRVRGAAAAGLGTLVSDQTTKSYKNIAVGALKRAAESDESSQVRELAGDALKGIGEQAPKPGPGPGPSAGHGGGAIYVNIGPMSSRTGDSGADGKLKALMVKIATKTMGKAASNMATQWAGGGVPTQAMLDAKHTMGFYVDGTLNELKIKESGSSTTVSCKINMLLASFPDKSIFGLLNGGASVQASGSASDIALAREDCVSAVVEDLIAKKIIPTINSKASNP